MERRYWFYFFVAAGAALAYGAVLRQLEILEKPVAVWRSLGLFIGPALVAFAWMFTNEVNIRNSRKQHTTNQNLQRLTTCRQRAGVALDPTRACLSFGHLGSGQHP